MLTTIKIYNLQNPTLTPIEIIVKGKIRFYFALIKIWIALALLMKKYNFQWGGHEYDDNDDIIVMFGKTENDAFDFFRMTIDDTPTMPDSGDFAHGAG